MIRKGQDEDDHASFEENDDDQDETIAVSVHINGSYDRRSGKCRRHNCFNRSAPHQVYCSRECAPFAHLEGEGRNNNKKQVYKKRPKKKKKITQNSNPPGHGAGVE
jgi:hypothetical protein